MEQKEYFMNEAILEAKNALELNEVPVGAVIVRNGEIIARAHNTRETAQVSLNHAELLAIEKACEVVGSWRLNDCELYVTLEPCVMCVGALILSRVEKVYFGAYDPKAGSVLSVARILDIEKYNHRVKYEGGILEEECSNLLKDFFKSLRQKK